MSPRGLTDVTFSINFFPPPPLRGQETTTSLDLIPAQVVQSEKMGKVGMEAWGGKCNWELQRKDKVVWREYEKGKNENIHKQDIDHIINPNKEGNT